MHPNIGKELTLLKRMTVAELRARYAQVFSEATRVGNKPWLIKRIAWRLQARAEGDLSERARQRAAQLADDADLRLTPPRPDRAAPVPATPVLERRHDRRLPSAGSIITRLYKGTTLQVQVLCQGFRYQGQVYASLSAVAKAVTGSHANGFLFFRLLRQGGAS